MKFLWVPSTLQNSGYETATRPCIIIMDHHHVLVYAERVVVLCMGRFIQNWLHSNYWHSLVSQNEIVSIYWFTKINTRNRKCMDDALDWLYPQQSGVGRCSPISLLLLPVPTENKMNLRSCQAIRDRIMN